MNSLRGTFWIDPDVRKTGTFSVQEDGTFLLELEGYVFYPEQIIRKTTTYADLSNDPAKLAADYWPRDVLGMLETGEPISLMGALMQRPYGPFAYQRFEVPSFVRGAHLHGRNDVIEGIRWRWRIPPPAVAWAKNPAAHVDGEVAGELLPWCDDHDAGLQLLLENPHPLDATLTRTREYSSQLIGLSCFGAPPRATLTEVRVNKEWYEYETPEEDPQLQPLTGLMPLGELTLAVFAAWLPKAERVHPFPFMLNSLTGILQLDALILGTLLEGLHRSLQSKKERPLAGISNNAVERAADVGRKAALADLERQGCLNLEVADKLLKESLAHINEPNYHDRVMALLKPVHKLIPSLFGPDLSDWVERTKTIRNAQSHQFRLTFDEDKIRQYYVFMASCRWAATLRILLEVLSETQIEEALKRSRTFHSALAHIDREGLWPGFSALQAFRFAEKERVQPD